MGVKITASCMPSVMKLYPTTLTKPRSPISTINLMNSCLLLVILCSTKGYFTLAINIIQSEYKERTTRFLLEQIQQSPDFRRGFVV